ncbi:MAG: hypothetical protein HZY76_02320 [Anaerolineae bacterium]|nr:MAG: hypothetical protein HZY76_02320 [Anaerolineae bacterium]
MHVTTFEGVVENGQIHLSTNVRLPEKTRVYVVVPDLEVKPVMHMFSPRLVHPEDAADFRKEVIEDLPDASL